jgi:hypothetical protein
MKPLCPLVEKRHRLEVSIVETCREGGKVRHKHIASLGSIANNNLEARDAFWRECEVRLARLSNRIGSDFDRLRQAIAERIPPLTDADREAMDAAARQWLEAGWSNRAEHKARESSVWNEIAKQTRREAIRAEALALKVRQSRGDPQAFHALNMLLGRVLAHDAMGTIEAPLKDLSRRQREFVEDVLADHPSLTVEEALAMLKEAGL